jgi:PPOX class probable F420-dependent enzyme
MSDDKLYHLSKHKYISVETYRKNGTGVRTPVWFVVSQGLIYFRTDAKSGKVKRIRNNPHVKIAPCNMGGNVEGDWYEGKAKFSDQAESMIAFSLINKKYGLLTTFIRLLNKIRNTKPLVISLILE